MITLQYDLLKFDITGVLGFEINQHIEFYTIGVEEAYLAIKNNDNSTALTILRSLKSQLDLEYKYFDSKRCWEFNFVNDAYSYVDGICRASRKLAGAPNYQNMRSMLYDIRDYMTRTRFDDDRYYGNVFALDVDKYLDEMTALEHHSHFGMFLQGIRTFYHRPGKVTAKQCLTLSKGLPPKDIEPFILIEYIEKYLR